MVDIVSLGEPMVEFNQNPDGLLVQGFGGDTSNAAISAARQGAKVGYITRLGEDPFGSSLIELWKSEGIDTSMVIRDPESPTGIYFVTHDEEGHHFSYYRKYSAASRMTASELPEGYIAGAKILHVSAISQAISVSATDSVFKAIQIANQHDTMVAYDTNLRLNLWPKARARAIIHAAMKQCQISLPSYDDAVVLTGYEKPQEIVDFYLGLGAQIVALKIGKKGVIIATPDRQRVIKGISVKAIDANAAGDTFAGAFLAEIARGKNPFEAGRYANIAAALSTTRSGAVRSIPTRKEVELLLKNE